MRRGGGEEGRRGGGEEGRRGRGEVVTRVWSNPFDKVS